MKNAAHFNGKAINRIAKTFMSVILAGALNVATVGNGYQAQP